MSPWTLRKRAPAHPPRHLHAIVPPELLDPQRSRSADAGAGNSSRCLGAKPAASSSRESDALLTRDCFDVWCADQKSIEHASLKRVTPVLLFARRRDIVDEGSRGARLAPWRIRSDDADGRPCRACARTTPQIPSSLSYSRMYNSEAWRG